MSDVIISMWELVRGIDFDSPRLARVVVSPELMERMKDVISVLARPAVWTDINMLYGVPLSVDETYAPDEWHAFDQFGQEMAR